MPLPNFNRNGDLPEGVHSATIEDVVARFGTGTLQRQRVTANLLRIYRLASATGKLDRLILFGSYITEKSEPHDVDVVLIMTEDFRPGDFDIETLRLFDHQQAAEFGASLFWARPAMLLEPLQTFIAYWQIKRDGTQRGIVEIKV